MSGSSPPRGTESTARIGKNVRDSWYADKRDLVKWGTLAHIALREHLQLIVQVPYARGGSRPTLRTSKGEVAIHPSVWTLSEAARSVKPKAIEQTVQDEIAGVNVRGIVDLLDVDGCVFDFKTSSKRPNGISAEHNLQLTTYAMITPEASGLCRLDTVTKTKTVKVVQQSYQVGPDDRRFAETLYPMVQESIRDGIYHPTAAVRCVRGAIAAIGARVTASSADASPNKLTSLPFPRIPSQFDF